MGKPGSIAGQGADSVIHQSRLALPPERPLDMPRQRQHAAGVSLRSGRTMFRAWTWLMRILLTATTAALTIYGVSEMYTVMDRSITPLQWAFLILFSINFTWISFAGTQALFGFLVLMTRDLLGRRHIHDQPPGIQTAVLVPVYNEDPLRVAAAIDVMARGLTKEAPGLFSFFILSDSNTASAWINEERTFHKLVAASSESCPVYYRHRRDNSERKAGNIADWVMRWGGGYEAMLVLDADSVMGPATMIEMARRMEAEPGLGLLQTVPSIVWGETLYARLQQFANRLYGPIFSHGLSIWHGEGSNFWGHNAIIRISAFAASAHLPILKGKPPFGGHVISHDFVEAALLRRSGWGVKLATDLNESYEEPPPSITDVMVRDRRWCQGNLQHSRFLFAKGLAMSSRLHILSGIMAYMSAVFWLMLVATGLLLAVQADITRPEYFTQPSLFPTWPVFNSERAINLFVLSMSIVLLPKFLGWCSAMINLRRCFRYGGPVLVTLSVLVEILLSALVAPIMMLAQSRMVWEIFTGGDSGWKPQRRDDGSISLGDALRRHKWHTTVGIAVSGLTYYLHHDLFLWTLPVTAGLMSSAFLSWASGKRSPSLALKRAGILRTPEEKRPGEILSNVRQALTTARAHAVSDENSTFTTLVNDADLCDWHCAQLPRTPAERTRFDSPQVLASAKAERASSLSALEAWLTPAERMAFLHDPALIRSLKERVAVEATLQLATK